MKICTRLCCFIFIFLLTFYLTQCTSSSESKTKRQVVSFADVWISDGVDADGDDFFSYYRLNMDLDVSQSSVNLFLQVGVRVYDPLDTATYHLYMESANFVIDGSTPDDAFFIPIGSPNAELPEGSYDFLIWIFKASDPENPILELASHNDDNFNDVLTAILIEESITDAALSIYDAYWDNVIDNDQDGYASQADLVVDVDVNLGKTTYAYLRIYQKSYNSSTYDLLAETETFTVSEASSADAVAFTVKNLSYNLYDFMIEVYYDVGHYVEDYDDALSNSELNDVKFELASGWIWYDDGLLEDGYSSNNPSYYAVRFDKPADAVICIVREIYLYVISRDTTTSYAQFNIWTSLNNYPNTEIWTTGNVYIAFDGDNYYHPVDIDISPYNQFYVGYYQLNGFGFYLGVDTTSPVSRSYFADLSPSNWTLITSSDFCIRIYVEYTISKNKNSTITHGEWIEATLAN